MQDQGIEENISGEEPYVFSLAKKGSMISWMPLCRTAWRGQCSTTCAAPILGPGCFGRYVASWIGHKHFFESSDRHCGTEGQLHAQGLDDSGGFPGTSDTRRPAFARWRWWLILWRLWNSRRRTWKMGGWLLSLQENPRPGVYMTAAVANLSYHMDVGQHAMQQAQRREWKCRPGGLAARCPAFGLPATGVVFLYRAELAGSASVLLVLFLQVAGMHHFVFPVVSRWVATSKQLLCHLPRFCFWRWTEQSEGSMCSLSGFDNIRVNKECMVFVESRCKVFLAGTL